jgi:type I restriction enzyme S subunit
MSRRVRTFGRLVEEGALEIGDGYRAKNEELGGNGLVFLRAAYLQDSGFVLEKPDRFISKNAEGFARKVALVGDVVITTKGNSTGRVGRIRESQMGSIYSPHLSYWRSLKSHEIDQNFLYYWSQGREFREQLEGMASSTDMAPYLSLRDQLRLLISLPGIDEQIAIGAILNALDEKIELNRQMNETLEAMARAIFKSWFIDFDPVRAKASHRHPYGMSATTAALFCDSFDESPLGKIPKGWTAVPLRAAFDVNPPRTLSKGTMAPYLDMANMPTTSPRAQEVVDRHFGSGVKFSNGDTLIARITPCLENGKTALVDFLQDGEVGWGSTEYIVLRSKPPLPLEYAYFLARSADFRAHAILNMTGTSGRQRVPISCFDGFLVVVPPAGVAEKFGRIVKPIMAATKQHDEESRTLAAIRDALLPKLMSGGIRVPAPTGEVASFTS